MALVFDQKLFKSDFKRIALHFQALYLGLKLILNFIKLGFLLMDELDLLFFERGCGLIFIP